MLVLIGASASGKTEIAKLLIKNFGFEKLVTTTTREIRPGEVKGVDYNFITLEEFFIRKNNDTFFETVKYNNNYYGTPKKSKDNNVLIVDPVGANNIYAKSKGNMFIMLVTDEEVRKQRMLSRGDSLEDTLARLENDRIHFSLDKLNHYNHLIDTSDETLADLAEHINELYKR